MIDRSSPWLALGLVLAGSYAAALNLTVIGVALPSIADGLGGTALDVDWVVTGFLVGVVVGQPAVGRLADRFGRRDVYLRCLAVFTVGATMCAAAPSMPVLVAGRFIQGLGGGGIIPLSMALVYELFPPHRRGMAMGIWGIGVAGAPAAGPPVGGLLVTNFGWRWVFVTFAVFAAVALVLSWIALRDSGFREPRTLDVRGWVLASVAVVAIVVGSRQIPVWGVTSATTAVVALVGVVASVTFVRHARRTANPVVDLSMFATRAFSLAMVVNALLAITQQARLIYLPVQLQVARDLDAAEVGLIVAPSALGVAAMMPIGGWLTDRVGARVPSVIGFVALAVAAWMFGHFDANDSITSLLVMLFIEGIGGGLVFVPLTVAAMQALPARYVAQASIVTNLTRQMSGAVSVAVLGAILVSQIGAVAPEVATPATEPAYNRLFLVTFWLAALGAILAVFLNPEHRRSSTLSDGSEAADDSPARAVTDGAGTNGDTDGQGSMAPDAPESNRSSSP